MNVPTNTDIIERIKSGSLVPYLGAGTLNTVSAVANGQAIPADSESLILAMTDGQPMAPRLMYEFPRAAMHIENKKGRKFIDKFLNRIYGETDWSTSDLHTWLADLGAPYIIDTNRDLQLQNILKGTPHNLIVGVARIAAHPNRFDIYTNRDGVYQAIDQDDVDTRLPTLFKPLGSPAPKPTFVASDADFVDYITELMGGFAIPKWIKEHRKDKQYLFLGMRFVRDTERMVMSDMIYGANTDCAGFAYIEDPTDKEKRFLGKKRIEVIERDWKSLIGQQASHAA